MPEPIKLFKCLITDFLSRHRNAANILLHIPGIPLVLFGIFRLFTAGWKTGLLSFFLGYLLQWIGHTYFEGSALGEWILIKRLVKEMKRRAG